MTLPKPEPEYYVVRIALIICGILVALFVASWLIALSGCSLFTVKPQMGGGGGGTPPVIPIDTSTWDAFKTYVVPGLLFQAYRMFDHWQKRKRNVNPYSKKS